MHHKGKKNNRNDHQPKMLLSVKQILLFSILEYVQRTIWRICILMLGCQGLRYYTVNYTCAPNTSRRVASAPSLTACMVAQTSSRTHIIPGGFCQCRKCNYQLFNFKRTSLPNLPTHNPFKFFFNWPKQKGGLPCSQLHHKQFCC